MTDHGHFHWNELNVSDAKDAKAFYEETIGWTFNGMDDPEGGTYWVAMDGETPVAGIFTMKGPGFEGIPNHWFAYIAVDDVDARLEKAVNAGAVVKRPPFDIPGIGRIAIVQDPSGAVLGWMTPAEQG
ncbi:MAG: VOC family protein [Geminicoccaceae bacterium]